MLLIDATNLGHGGGGALLGYLLETISNRPFTALVSANTGISPSNKIVITKPCSPLGWARQTQLENAVRRCKPETVFCFGNIPPRRRLSAGRTVTYFQNAHLVSQLDQRCRYGLRDRTRYYLLRKSIRKWQMNTDAWLFQTTCIGDAFQKEYGLDSRSRIIPFFDEAHLRQTCTGVDPQANRNGFVYVSDDRPHKNHARLLKAWSILRERFAITPALHLTIPHENSRLVSSIEELNKSGLQIRNHGILPRQSVLELTARCEYVVFPSLLETIGLGLVEGCLLGCKVLVSNDPTYAEIIQPSGVFEPLSPQSIADCVVAAIKEPCPQPKIVLRNQIDELIALLFS
jgi:glycosyltransferase involved in cell wall biosynthesis